jgi:hypothetical protein
MPPSLNLLIQSLKLPSLGKVQVLALKSLQDNWERHSERMEQLRPERAMLDQKAAYGAYTANPSPENEQRLAVLADERLTTKRYALLRQAHAEVRHQIMGKATSLLRSHRKSIQHSLRTELQSREAAAEAEGRSKRTDEGCLQLRMAAEELAQWIKLFDQGGEDGWLEMFSDALQCLGGEDASAKRKHPYRALPTLLHNNDAQP